MQQSKVSDKNYGIIMGTLALATFGLSANFASFFGKGNSHLTSYIFAGGIGIGLIGISIFHWTKGRYM